MWILYARIDIFQEWCLVLLKVVLSTFGRSWRLVVFTLNAKEDFSWQWSKQLISYWVHLYYSKHFSCFLCLSLMFSYVANYFPIETYWDKQEFHGHVWDRLSPRQDDNRTWWPWMSFRRQVEIVRWTQMEDLGEDLDSWICIWLKNSSNQWHDWLFLFV